MGVAEARRGAGRGSGCHTVIAVELLLMALQVTVSAIESTTLMPPSGRERG